ncbi:UNVERIFIED_CONTAM: hypothetical protein Sindi_0857200, partial [Sesamum indicum]
FWTGASLFVEAGYPPLPTLTSFMDTYAKLADAPKPDEEVTYELSEILLCAGQVEEAPDDPGDQVMEDAFPQGVPPPAIGDEGVPPPAAK